MTSYKNLDFVIEIVFFVHGNWIIVPKYDIFIYGGVGVYSEILKIIEGSVTNDRQKSLNYAKKLADLYSENGENKIADKIRKIIQEKDTNLATLDNLIARPFDKETKMEMVDVSLPTENNDVLIFNEIIENEISDFILSYAKRDNLMSKGIETRNHLLVYGPPGTGKTSLAKYVSLQTGLPLVTARLDGLVSSFLGSTAKNIRKIFDYASKEPCILFLDEFDVLAKIRDDKNELGELKRVVNSLLQNIDNFSEDSILIAATNHAQLLDEAVWRRFTKVLKLDLPDEKLRRELIIEFSALMENNYQNDSKKIKELSSAMEKFSPADIKSVIYSAAKKSILNNSEQMNYGQIIYEIFLKNFSDEGSIGKAVEFLIAYKVPQREVGEVLNISIRKVRNILEERKNGR